MIWQKIVNVLFISINYFCWQQSDIRQKGDGNIQGGLKFLGHFIHHFRSQVSSESSKILVSQEFLTISLDMRGGGYQAV